jgi:hypothetical protein
MSKIELDEHYSIETDSNQWILKYEGNMYIASKGRYKGKEVCTKDQWYYPSLELCLKQYIREIPKPAKDIKELMDLINKAMHSIENITYKFLTK